MRPGTLRIHRRESVSAELLRTGTDSRVVQTLMRHASLATTARYLAVDQDQQRTAVERF